MEIHFETATSKKSLLWVGYRTNTWRFTSRRPHLRKASFWSLSNVPSSSLRLVTVAEKQVLWLLRILEVRVSNLGPQSQYSINEFHKFIQV